MNDRQYAARRRGNQIVAFFNEGRPVDYMFGDGQTGQPVVMTYEQYEKTYKDLFYLVDDPNWKPNKPTTIPAEMRKKIRVGTVAEFGAKGRPKLKDSNTEQPSGYSADSLLTLFASYLEIYRATNSEESKIKTKIIAAFLIKLDPALKDKVQERIQASKEDEIEL